MKKSKNDDLNGKTKNKKYSNNISVEKSNKDLADKKEDNLKIIPERSDVDNQKESEQETNREKKLLNEITILKEEKLRLLAEMENLRKRFEREKIDLFKFGSINLIREILSPGDNLERALAAIPKDEKIQMYATRLGQQLGVGKKDKNNGLLILIAPNDRQVSIATGYGTEKILTDYICKVIIDSTMIPKFKNQDYYGGVNSALDSIIAKWH